MGMPKFSGMEQQVSSDPNGMTQISRPAPKLNMNSGAVIGDMPQPQIDPKLRGTLLDKTRNQVRRQQFGQ